ncbi:PerC family transcriptional regulator [Salmonella enterica subsp. enterica serovar Ball]|nr:PerC family transcriptional regulator [Salmonella enterica subsp. enterica serovar Minnesota]ECI4646612.1 PerC family transcriptional regulator [Salmonella enterica subsp. salamae]EDV5024111.1 PerC family transcriptional regulator [Salmonella enterica subsp. enterica serovar Ball]EGO7252354.1 PerC family transcriptional regulator [Salmonella enterica]
MLKKHELEDRIAEDLERKGYWRRAARRWLDVIETVSKDKDREYAVRRRNRCVSMLRDSTRTQ